MKKIFFYTIASILVIFTSSCNNWMDVNTDPTSPQEVNNAALLLPPAVAGLAQMDFYDFRYVGSFCGYWGRGSAGYFSDRLNESKTSGVQYWRNHYWAIGTNMDDMIADGKKSGFSIYVGMAETIRALSWLTATERCGPMPYDNAWNSTMFTWPYNTQETVYNGVDSLCNDALVQFEKAKKEPVDAINLKTYDGFYHGDISNWEKLVYAVKARREIHLFKKNIFDADKAIEYVNKSFAGENENFVLPSINTTNNDRNFWGPSRANMGGGSPILPNQYFINELNGTIFNGIVDPRLAALVKPCDDGIYRGVEAANGDPYIGTLFKDRVIPIQYGLIWSNDNSPYPIITYAELQFIKAEAYFIKGANASALDAMKTGIAANMATLEVPSSAANAYLSSAAIPDAASLTIGDIMRQKHIALFRSCESWMDMRRYEYDPAIYTGIKYADPDGSSTTKLWPDWVVDGVAHYPYRWFVHQNSEYDWNRVEMAKTGGLNLDYPTYSMWIFESDASATSNKIDGLLDAYKPKPIH